VWFKTQHGPQDSKTRAMTRLTYAALRSGLSTARLAAYSLPTDRDSIDAVSRYQWDMAIAAAMLPAFQLVEVTFRNALFESGVTSTRGPLLSFGKAGCWLDANPTLLMDREAAKVSDAIRLLGHDRKRHTSGHLVAQLDFGFWIQLCASPYEHGRTAGPQLWPTATRRFPNCPRTRRNRADIQRAFSELRKFRNRIAHHHPIWDQQPLFWHHRAIELLSWMNADLARAAAAFSTLSTVVDSGPAAFRGRTELLMRLW
jgi:hypothetical protein